MLMVAFVKVAVFFLGFCQQASAALPELYTTNAVCGRKNCINPLFPGLEDLGQLEEARWICSSALNTAGSLGFCQGAIGYDPALPLPAGKESIGALVRKQDNAASTAFFYHLTGMGYEAWDYREPKLTDNECVRSIWRMVCYTYFPRAPVGCADGSETGYMRPCKSSCQNYINDCGVECCDESVQCVFTHTKQLDSTTSFTQTGYVDHDGPSSLCTGAAHRGQSLSGLALSIILVSLAWASGSVLEELVQAASHLPGRKVLAVGMLVMIAMSLQGCNAEVPEHAVANWRGEPDYLIENQYIPPGGNSQDGVLNSCALTNLSPTLQCSGRGTCRMWRPDDLSNRLAFCECDIDWADPECKTRRKSQAEAFFLSMFLGWMGADQFYLGFIGTGTMKLCTLGGFGVWWAIDIIRIGSAPVATTTYRLAADLSHWVFVLSVVSFGMAIGFIVVYITTLATVRQKKIDGLLMQMDEERREASNLPAYSSLYESNEKPPVRPAGRGDDAVSLLKRDPGAPDYGAAA